MYLKSVKVFSEMGIHAKTATKIIKLTTKLKTDVYLKHNDKLINAKSIVSILSAKIKHNDEIQVLSEHNEKIVDELVEIIGYDI